MADVHLRYISSVFCKVEAEPSIIMELADAFKWKAPNYKFHPKYRARVWDGNISLVNRVTGVIYAGLSKRIKKFCDARDYTISFDPKFTYEDIKPETLAEFIATLGIPEHFDTRDYQFDSILKCIQSGRRTLLSPTSSGKSFMIYVITQWYDNLKSLIIVPTTGLVTQMENDFREYGFRGTISTSIGGLDKSYDIDADVVITTWQSLDNGKNKMPKAWYNQFGVVFGDEAHGCKAASLKAILENLENCRYRFGTTGTLDGDPLNEATIEGLFGPQYKSITTAELIEQGYATPLRIECIILKYPEQVCKDQKGKTYPEEIDFLVHKDSRNKFIRNLVKTLDGNKLVFFRLRDHGEILKDLLEPVSDNLFYIDGGVDAGDREDIRKIMENEDNATLLASMGTTSTGVSIKKLHHMVAASPSKSKIKVLQSIGRMLRQHKQKEEAVLYDIADDLTYKGKPNYTLQHFKERVKIYSAEGFPFKIYTVELKS